MGEIAEITQELIRFRDERDWKQFHDSKNLSVAISIEAAELNEIFLWKDAESSENCDRQRISEELADVLSFCFLLAEKHSLDVRQIVLDKIHQNAIKYPVEKSKGSSNKYDAL